MPTGFGDLPWGEGPWGDGDDETVVIPPLIPTQRSAATQAEIDELGIDIDVIDDLPPTFALAKGKKNLANAILRRLSTPAGALASGFGGDPDYGFDIRGRLNSGSSLEELSSLESQVEDECRKDERVQSAEVKVTYTLATSTLQVDILLETAVGPFRLILGVGDVTIDLLRIE